LEQDPINSEHKPPEIPESETKTNSSQTNSQNSIIPQIEAATQDVIGKSQSSNVISTVIEPQTETMEVHKHPHHVTHKKKWIEYFLEFLMIFSAVTLGFYAENIREHASDTAREKEYMRSMVEDLKQDTSNCHKVISPRLSMTRWRLQFIITISLLRGTGRCH